MSPRRSFVALLVAVLSLSSASARGETIQITIEKLVFSPVEASAKIGDTIEWMNKDILAHTATATNGDWNVLVSAGKNGQTVVKKAGSVDYYCKFHPNMKGRIIIAP